MTCTMHAGKELTIILFRVGGGVVQIASWQVLCYQHRWVKVPNEAIVEQRLIISLDPCVVLMHQLCTQMPSQSHITAVCQV